MGIAISAGKGKKKRGRGAPEMNVTPLVDVVLVLLIIFMVITPLLSKQFWLALPDPKEQDEPQNQVNQEPIVVTVTKDGRFRINREQVSEKELETRLHRMLAARKERSVFFDAHDDASFARASQALDITRAAGAATIAIATERLVTD